MVAASAAWKHSFSTAGNAQNRTPGSFGFTPATFQGGTAYTAAQLTTIATDDLVFVVNNFITAFTTTGRSNHMFEFDVATPNLLTAISNLTRYDHRRGLADIVYTIRMYVWNAATVAWEQLATNTGTGSPITIGGSVVANFADYVDGGGKLYILIWDYEGTHRSGGGCLLATTLVHTAEGLRPAIEVKPWDEVWGLQDGKPVSVRVDEVTHHAEQEWRMIRITVKGVGRVEVTDDHPMQTERGEMPASAVRVGDAVPTMDGWGKVSGVESFDQKCIVVDIWPRVKTFLVGDGIGVNRIEVPR